MKRPEDFVADREFSDCLRTFETSATKATKDPAFLPRLLFNPQNSLLFITPQELQSPESFRYDQSSDRQQDHDGLMMEKYRRCKPAFES